MIDYEIFEQTRDERDALRAELELAYRRLLYCAIGGVVLAVIGFVALMGEF